MKQCLICLRAADDDSTPTCNWCGEATFEVQTKPEAPKTEPKGKKPKKQ